MPKLTATVIAASAMVSYQDLGRTGYRKLGIAPAGVLDPHSALQANQLLGNLPQDTLIEIGPGGFEIELHTSTWLALAGSASCADLTGTARQIPAGKRLKITGSPDGLWSYLAAPGGWLSDASFGSHSFHSRSDLGPKLAAGDHLGYHEELHFPSVATRHLADTDLLKLTDPPSLRLHPGPHFSEFSPADLTKLVSQAWKISPHSDRSGYHLIGNPLKGSGTIPSLPVLVGSLQVPPSGELIVTLNDGPTVGGYPIIALLEAADLPYLVQRPSASLISFTWHE